MKVKLKDLLAKRATLVAEMKAIRTKEDDLPASENISDDDATRFTAIESEISALDARVQRVETELKLDADSSEPAAPGEGDDESKFWNGHGTMGADGRVTPFGYGEKTADAAVASDRLKGKGFRMAQFSMGVIAAKSGMGFGAAAEMIERRFGKANGVAKALNTSGVATGGALIPQEFSNEIIELLRADVVIRQCEPTLITMPGGNLTIPRLAGGATAGYQGELDDMSPSQQTFDDLQLNAKKLTALVPVSNDLLRRAPIGVEALVRNDMIEVLARREDLAFMLGDGSGGSPIGLLNLCAASQKLLVAPFTATDNVTILTAVSAVLQGMMLTLRQNMSKMIRPVWITSPGVESFLLTLRDGVGNFIYKDELENGRLMGRKFVTTQQLPSNINTGTTGTPANNGSYLFLVDFADIILAETFSMSVDASDVASYKDGGGNMVSTFVRDQTAFRIIEEHDFNVRHQASIAVAVLPNWFPAGFSGNAGFSFYTQAPSGDSSAAPSTFGVAAPTGSNNPANVAAAVPGGTLPGRA